MSDLDLTVALFAALEAGEVEEALGFLHPEVMWSPIGLGGSDALNGRAATQEWLEEFGHQPGRIHVEIRDVFRLHDWVVALGTVDDSRSGLGEVSPVGWDLGVTDELVVEAHGYDSWSQALDTAGGWAGQDVDLEEEAPLFSPRPPLFEQPSGQLSHPHRAPAPSSAQAAA